MTIQPPTTFKKMLQRITEKVLEDDIDLDTWEDAFEDELDSYHLAAYAHGAGVGVGKLTSRDHSILDKFLKTQREHLKEYRRALHQGEYKESPGVALRRSQMYADATKASWWMGKTRGLVLPAYPCDGTTQCLTNCDCSWNIKELAGDGNYDATWTLGPTDHCQTCMQRAEEWAPYKIRGGEVQL